MTNFVGLENNCPCPFVNPILQVLYSIDKIRAAALVAQGSTYHHQNPNTLWCELGFLFHMMLAIENEALLSALATSSSTSLGMPVDR
jgi:ubiquitin C-terminal hydrolase